jgi:capsid protein
MVKKNKYANLQVAGNSTVSLGYNAVEDVGRRQPPQAYVKAEDVILTAFKRQKLEATAQEQYRNHALLAWMVRKHLAYVTRFEPHFRTGKEKLDRRMMDLFTWHSRKENFDIAGRHDRNAMMMVYEACKVLGGDAGMLKLKTGHLQGIESDRIVKPQDIPTAIGKRVNDQGLNLDDYSRVLEYCITRRGDNGQGHFYDKMVKAADIIYDGYFFRFDQYRGISPLSAAINGCQDLAESWEWTLLKIKVHSLFGIAVKRAGNDGTNYNKAGNNATGTTNPTANTGTVPNQIKPNGIISLDLKPDDDVDTIESKTPSNEMQSYSELMIRIVLLALDIPYTAFNSMSSSFSARIADRVEYEEAARSKREKNADALRQYSDWKIDNWISDSSKLGKVAKEAGMTADDLKYELEWIPAGTPWLDKTKEVDGDTRALAVSADSIPRICKRRGLDAFTLIDENAEVLEYAKKKGVPVYFGSPGQIASNNDPANPDNNPDAAPANSQNNTKENP